VIRPRRPAAGFTLIEAIVAMVLTGILAGIVMTFMVKPVQSYFDSVSRAELTDAADVALRRITRDVRRALPNSLRQTSATSFEFILTKAGGRYRDQGDGSTGGDFLSYTSVADTTFDVLGPVPANPAIAVGDFIVILNYGPGNPPVDAYTGGNRATVQGIVGNVITLTANPFAAQVPPLPSPDARFQVVGSSDLVVRYTCPGGGALTRYAGCSLATPSVCAGSGAVLAGSGTTTAACSIEYTANATGRNGLLYVQLTLTSGTERVVLSQQIHVDNTP
jgi:MSHA biogenesis protein MshO